MPKKIRELKQILSKAGFTLLRGRGKGSHTMWRHPLCSEDVRLSGQDGSDAKPYQEKVVEQAIKEVERNREDE